MAVAAIGAITIDALPVAIFHNAAGPLLLNVPDAATDSEMEARLVPEERRSIPDRMLQSARKILGAGQQILNRAVVVDYDNQRPFGGPCAIAPSVEPWRWAIVRRH